MALVAARMPRRRPRMPRKRKDGSPGFILLSDRFDPSMHDAASGESLLDHGCQVLRPAGS